MKGVDRLAFECVDFGEVLRLNTAMKQKQKVGEDTDTEKCAIMALEAVGEWADQGHPTRRPSRRRVDVLAISIRAGGILGADQACDQTTGGDLRVALETNSICHDVMTANQ